MMAVNAADNGMYACHSWDYRVMNSLFEHSDGRGLFFDIGTQDYVSNIFIQANEDDGGEWRASCLMLHGIHSNGNAGDGFVLNSSENGLTNSEFVQNDSNGLEIGTIADAEAAMGSYLRCRQQPRYE